MAVVETFAPRGPDAAQRGQSEAPNLVKGTSPEASRLNRSAATAPDVLSEAERDRIARHAASGREQIIMSASSEFAQLRIMEMAAQIAASYVSHHTVTAVHTVKYIDEIHKALTLYLTPEWAPAPPRRPWAKLLMAAAGGALVAIAAAVLLITMGQAKGGIPIDLATSPVPAEAAASTTGRIRAVEGNRPEASTERGDHSRPEKTGLHETYNDWDITCIGPEGVGCNLSQGASATGNYAAARIALKSGQEAGTLDGTITLPFEVPPTSRITLQTGAGGLKGPLSFQACRSEGCVLSFTFSEREISELRRASLLQANAAGDDGRTLSFQFSLKGFSSAYDRMRTPPP